MASSVNGVNGVNGSPLPTTHNLTETDFPSFIGRATEDGCNQLLPPDIMGPMLQYLGTDLVTQQWQASVLYVITNAQLPKYSGGAPQLVVVDGNDAPVQVPGVRISSYQCWGFWRFQLDLPLLAEGRQVAYRLDGDVRKPRPWAFHVAGKDKGFNWAYYSCAGFSGDVPGSFRVNGYTSVWGNLLERHGKDPYHLVYGGGDQLYNDQVLGLPSISEWVNKEPAEARNAWPFSDRMKAEAEGFYFTHYMVHYNETWVQEVVASIPQMMIWDDHDIFDGVGSYGQALQTSPAFIGLYQAARRFYLLFQRHTTDELAAQHGFIVQGTAVSQLALLGPRTALLAADMRSERTRNQVMPKGAWPELREKLGGLPGSVRHVVLASGAPVVYAKTAAMEGLLHSSLGSVLGSGKFDEPGDLDDLLDQWMASTHQEEKREMISLLQDLAATRGIRVSFVSGDVHQAAFGRLRSSDGVEVEKDHKYMLQVVSSPIVNKPAPDKLVVLMRTVGALSGSSTLMPGTEEELLPTFGSGGGTAGVTDKLLNKRNFCLIHEDEQSGALVFTLVLEYKARQDYKPYTQTAPLLHV